jgi:hypothetical protein
MTNLRHIKPRLYGAIGYRPYWAYTYLTFDYFLRDFYRKNDFSALNYYEFGTGKGRSLIEFLKALRRLLKVSSYKNMALTTGINIILFDSFEGLPAPKSIKDIYPVHSKGAFAHPEEEIRNLVQCYSRHIKPKPRAITIKGYYENTLTSSLREELKGLPPSFVNVDVDYYSSAISVLNFIAPICQNGTVFYFNNIYEHLGNLAKGEYAAISEFNERNSGSYHLFPNRVFTISEYISKVFVMHRVDTNS